METTNEILDSTSHDCPLVTQTYSTAVAKGAHVPASPTRLGKGCDPDLEASDAGPPGGPVLCALLCTGQGRDMLTQGPAVVAWAVLGL